MDFGKVRTNGSVVIKRDGKNLLIIPYPRDKKFLIELSKELFTSGNLGFALHIEQELELTKVIAIDSKHNQVGSIDVKIDENTLSFETSEEACYYLITPK